MRQFYVYILSSRSRTLYVGVTNDLIKRLTQHRQGTSGFTAKYRVNRLVYFEVTERPLIAIAREKQIKAYRREKKVALVTSMNPGWDDLSEQF
ncbi:MAG: GIY-YIG nuclease family protein [Gemmatimonadaceae bacterium]